jgi:hypothetical protein
MNKYTFELTSIIEELDYLYNRDEQKLERCSLDIFNDVLFMLEPFTVNDAHGDIAELEKKEENENE